MQLLVLLGLILCVTATNSSTRNTCGGNCPSNDCTDCPCGLNVNRVNIATYCSRYSDWSQGCCQCIANHESGGNAHAVNHNTGGSDDVGLYQVNSGNWASCNGGHPPCDPGVNAACAHMVWKWGGGTWKYWSTCSACGCCNRA